MKLNDTFDQFNALYGYKKLEKNADNLEKAHDLIYDELYELEEEYAANLNRDYELKDTKDINQTNVAKEMTDIIYITMQQMRAMGMDIDGLLKEVHRSNMSKTVRNSIAHNELAFAKKRYPEAYIDDKGNFCVLRCGTTGKVIKPTTYTAANITEEYL